MAYRTTLASSVITRFAAPGGGTLDHGTTSRGQVSAGMAGTNACSGPSSHAALTTRINLITSDKSALSRDLWAAWHIRRPQVQGRPALALYSCDRPDQDAAHLPRRRVPPETRYAYDERGSRRNGRASRPGAKQNIRRFFGTWWPYGPPSRPCNATRVFQFLFPSQVPL